MASTNIDDGPLSAIDGAPVWLNSDPLTAAALRGSVVLVDFWTYSCVNWLRTLPYVSAWQERYRDDGLVVYEEVERAIQRQLGVDGEPVRVDADGLAEAADWGALGSPETYLGHARGERRRDRPGDELALNEWALAGRWSIGDEAAVLAAAGGSIAYRFQARDLNLVLAPPDSGAPVRFVVRLDGRPPADAHGVDVDAAGEGTLAEPRMYQLVPVRGGAAQRTFEITFSDPGVSAYVFTFG